MNRWFLQAFTLLLHSKYQYQLTTLDFGSRFQRTNINISRENYSVQNYHRFFNRKGKLFTSPIKLRAYLWYVPLDTSRKCIKSRLFNYISIDKTKCGIQPKDEYYCVILRKVKIQTQIGLMDIISPCCFLWTKQKALGGIAANILYGLLYPTDKKNGR